jgi:hypothetical protein
MTIKKLVRLDDETWGWTEIDPVKLRRVASAFKEWLLTVDPQNDPFAFLRKDLPLVEASLNGTLKLPNHSYPHQRELGEGWLPADYRRISAPFYNTIAGALMEPPKVIEKDGKRYAWAEFEEPGDEPK